MKVVMMENAIMEERIVKEATTHEGKVQAKTHMT